MEIRIQGPLAPDSAAGDFDVRQLKKALNRLGFYTPPHNDIGITGLTDNDLFSAIRTYQAARGLPVTGQVKPDDETLGALNADLARALDGYYIWRTVGDDKVRSEHARYNGTVRAWSDTPDPGEDYNCRCWAEAVEPGLNPVYPELLLLPLLRLPRLFIAWKNFNQIGNADWRLGKHKSLTKWGNQLKSRDWTPQQIAETLRKGKKYKAPNKVNPKNTATRYEYKGKFVVQDDQTKEILQVSGSKNFMANK